MIFEDAQEGLYYMYIIATFSFRCCVGIFKAYITVDGYLINIKVRNIKALS